GGSRRAEPTTETRSRGQVAGSGRQERSLVAMGATSSQRPHDHRCAGIGVGCGKARPHAARNHAAGRKARVDTLPAPAHGTLRPKPPATLHGSRSHSVLPGGQRPAYFRRAVRRLIPVALSGPRSTFLSPSISPRNRGAEETRAMETLTVERPVIVQAAIDKVLEGEMAKLIGTSKKALERKRERGV